MNILDAGEDEFIAKGANGFFSWIALFEFGLVIAFVAAALIFYPVFWPFGIFMLGQVVINVAMPRLSQGLVPHRIAMIMSALGWLAIFVGSVWADKMEFSAELFSVGAALIMLGFILEGIVDKASNTPSIVALKLGYLCSVLLIVKVVLFSAMSWPMLFPNVVAVVFPILMVAIVLFGKKYKQSTFLKYRMGRILGLAVLLALTLASKV